MRSRELKTLRETLNLRQIDLAKKLGVHAMTVSKWERGETEIPRVVELALREIQRSDGR